MVSLYRMEKGVQVGTARNRKLRGDETELASGVKRVALRRILGREGRVVALDGSADGRLGAGSFRKLNGGIQLDVQRRAEIDEFCRC